MASRANSILAAVEVLIRNERTDGELLREFLDTKTEAAFAALVRRHGPMVSGVCRRILGHADDADDAAQDVWLAVWRGLPRLADPDALPAWVRRVARDRAFQEMRRRNRRLPAVPLAADPPASEPDALLSLLLPHAAMANVRHTAAATSSQRRA